MNKLNDQLSKNFKINSFHDSKFETPSAIEYKVVILGDRGVGKSSICNRLIKNEFNLEIKPTSQNECYWKIFKLYDQTIYLYIIDIEDNFLTSDRNMVYSGLDGALIVYDVTKSKSLEEVERWTVELKQHTNEKIPFVLIGNKNDLNFLRNVDSEEGSKKAIELDCDFFETSCVEDKNFLDIFKYLISKIYFHNLTEEEKSKFLLTYTQNQNTKDLAQMSIKNAEVMTKQNSEANYELTENFNTENN